MAEKSIASSKSGSKQSYIIQEKTGFEKFSADLKDSVFQVLYLILKDEDSSLVMFLLSTVPDYMQMAAFAFDNNISSVWKAQDFLGIVFQVFNFFQLGTYFKSAFTYTNFLISFYLCIAAIVLMLINILYVSYSFSKKRMSSIWPVMVLRSVTSLFFTVFFLPITELLITMIECTYDDKGQYVLTTFNDVLCFKDSHIIHAAISIIIDIIFVIIGFIVSLAYFEVRMITEDITARQHSRGDVLFILNKIALQITFSFFSNNSQWWLVLTLIVGAYILWHTYNFGEPYYNKTVSACFNIMTTYYLWTAFMVFVCKLLEDTSFTGGLIAWLIGLPFIGVIIWSSTKSRSNKLAQGSSRFRTSQDLMDHLRFVLQLIDNYKTDKSAYIFLTGYVEKHKETCGGEHCPLKTTKKRNGKESMDDIIVGLRLVVENMYENGIKKFKNSAKLRIAYAIFLLERMKKTKKAEIELMKAKEFNPGFEDQFVIFRLNKLISDGMGVDVVGLFAWENYKNLYQEYIRESADLHKEFWMELREDKPNLHKLSYLGSRVNNAMSNAKEYWQKVSKIKQNNTIILRTYGRFLIDIQNENAEGRDMIEKAKNLVLKEKTFLFAKKSLIGVNLDHLPYVEVVGKGQDLGKIKHANLLFSVLVGASKEEIIEKKINLYMPELFAAYHDTFLNRYENRDEEQDIGYLDQEQSLFVRTKSGFITPVTLCVSRLKVEETSNQSVFSAWFKTETAKRIYIYFLCSRDGIITDMSASAVTLLNLSLLNVKKNKMNISEIVPNFLAEKLSKEPNRQITYKVNQATVLQFSLQILQYSLKDADNTEFKEAYLNANSTKYTDAYGYAIRLEKIEKHADMPHVGTVESGKLSNSKRRRDTMAAPSLDREGSIRSEEPSRLSRAEYLEVISKQENDNQLIRGFETENVELELNELGGTDTHMVEQLMKGEEEEVRRERIDYGVGVNLKKMQNGKLIDIHSDTDQSVKNNNEEEDEEEDDDEDLFDIQNVDGGKSKKKRDKQSALRRLVKDALEANQRSGTVSTIRWLTFIWLLTLYVIGIVQFTLLSQLFNDYKHKIHVVRTFVDKITEISNINSYIIDLVIFNTDPALEGTYTNSDIAGRRAGIQTSVGKIVELTKELEEETLYKFVSPFITDTIKVTVYGNSTSKDMMLHETEAIFFIASRAYNLITLPLSDFTTTNSEVYTVLNNFYNRILPVLRESVDQMHVDFNHGLNTTEYKFTLLFSLNAVAAIIISIWVIRLLVSVEQQKEDVLFLFLEIPLGHVGAISLRRDKFMEFFESTIRHLQNDEGSDNDNDSDNSFDMRDDNNFKNEGIFDESLKEGGSNLRGGDSQEEEEALKNRKKLIKKFKSNNFNKARSGFFRVFTSLVVSLIFSMSSFISIAVNKREISHYSTQYFTNNLLSDSILSTINTNRLMRVDSDFQIGDKTATLASLDSLKDLNMLGNNLGNFFLYVISENNDLEKQVTKLFFGNACEFIPINVAECQQSLSQSLRLGIFNLKEQIFKILMEEYTSFTNTSTTTTAQYSELMEVNDEFKDHTYRILHRFGVIEEGFLSSILSDATSLQEILLIVYLISLTFGILLFWLPHVSMLNAEVWRTMRMINMIPVEVLSKVTSITKFLKNLTRGTT